MRGDFFFGASCSLFFLVNFQKKIVMEQYSAKIGKKIKRNNTIDEQNIYYQMAIKKR